jgi:hypothetical protein
VFHDETRYRFILEQLQYKFILKHHSGGLCVTSIAGTALVLKKSIVFAMISNYFRLSLRTLIAGFNSWYVVWHELMNANYFGFHLSKLTLRLLIRNPFFTFINVLALSVSLLFYYSMSVLTSNNTSNFYWCAYLPAGGIQQYLERFSAQITLQWWRHAIPIGCCSSSCSLQLPLCYLKLPGPILWNHSNMNKGCSKKCKFNK